MVPRTQRETKRCAFEIYWSLSLSFFSVLHLPHFRKAKPKTKTEQATKKIAAPVKVRDPIA
jgi:hypothetical protein